MCVPLYIYMNTRTLNVHKVDHVFSFITSPNEANERSSSLSGRVQGQPCQQLPSLEPVGKSAMAGIQSDLQAWSV